MLEKLKLLFGEDIIFASYPYLRLKDGLKIIPSDQAKIYVIFTDISFFDDTQFYDYAEGLIRYRLEEIDGTKILFISHQKLAERDVYYNPTVIYYLSRIAPNSTDEKYLIEAIVSVLDPSRDISQIYNEIRNIMMQRTSERIVSGIIERLQGNILERRREIDDALNRMYEARRAYLSRCQVVDKLCVDVNKDFTQETEQIKTEIANIIRHKKVADVTVNSDSFTVITVPLVLHEPVKDHYYRLGRMTAKIPFDANYGIKIGNLDNIRNGAWNDSPHPHVSGSGTPCWGTADAQVAQFILDRQYYGLFITLLNFMQTCDIKDFAGKHVTAWDRCDKDGNLLTADEISSERNSDGFYICESCGEEVPEGEHYICEDCERVFCALHITEAWDDHWVCYTCLDRNYEPCTSCDEMFYREDMNSFEDEDDLYCDECYSREARRREEEEERDRDIEADLADMQYHEMRDMELVDLANERTA